jgi:MoaA/NifB/PqqE/SkfB family radical SAM enzyme
VRRPESFAAQKEVNSVPDVPLWTDCNQACAFCSNPTGEFRDQAAAHSFEALKEKLAKHKSREGRVFPKFDEARDYFTLTGGEPTLHPEFFEVLEYIKREFPDRELRLLSNARTLASEPFAKRLLEAAGSPFEVGVILCGPDAETHERIAGTGAGGFEQTVRGIENLLRLRREGQRVELRMVLTAMQMSSLRATLKFMQARFPEADRTTLIFLEMEGRSHWRFDELKQTMTGCAKQLDSLYSILKAFKELRLYHFPLCALPPRLWPFVWNTLDPRKVVYKLECRDCPMRPQCVGIHKSYARWVGADDLGPVSRPEGISVSKWDYHPIEAVGR